MIPTSFEEWKRCIEVDCGIKLDYAFARERLRILEDSRNPETIKFKELYGLNHLNNVISWFKKLI